MADFHSPDINHGERWSKIGNDLPVKASILSPLTGRALLVDSGKGRHE